MVDLSQEFRRMNKPIAMCCIAPVIAAKVFGEKVTVTLGKQDDEKMWPYGGAMDAAK